MHEPCQFRNGGTGGMLILLDDKEQKALVAVYPNCRSGASLL